MRKVPRIRETISFISFLIILLVFGVSLEGIHLAAKSELNLRFQTATETNLYDATKWKIIKRTRAEFGAELSGCDVLLLKSVKPTSGGGAGQPLYDVNLLVIKDGKAVYDYLKEGLKPPNANGLNFTEFYMSDTLDVRDVTSDGVPEIIFHSGFEGASDFTKLNHILRYDKSLKRFVDVAPHDFAESGTAQLRWTTVIGRPVAVVAHRDWDAWEAKSPAPEDRCHYCNGPYLYDAFVWDSAGNAFTHYQTLKATKEFGEGETALNTDWTYITVNLALPPK